MPIVMEKELIGKVLLVDEKKFLPGNYAPKIRGCNVSEYISEKLKTNQDKPWMTELTNKRSVLFSELPIKIERISNWLRKRGVEPGDGILVTADNCIEIPLLFFGAWKAGAFCGGLDVNMSEDEIKDVTIETKPKFVVVDEIRSQKVLDATKDLTLKVITIGKSSFGVSFDELLSDENEQGSLPQTEMDLEATAWISFSSGTTGPPKPIIHTHRNLSPFLQPDEKPVLGNKFLFTNLMIHGSGLFSFLRTTGNFTSGYTFFKRSTESILQAFEFLKPSYVSMLSYEVAELCKFSRIAKYDVSSVETVVYTGSGVAPQHELEIFDKLPNLTNLISMFGSSEIMLLTLSDPKPKPPLGTTREQVKSNHIVGSSGEIRPYVKIKIIDPETGGKLGPKEQGEIVAWSPFLMKGYLNRPEGTARVIRNGWYYTGDRGYYDENENLFIAGRYKEIIKYRTVPVVPAHVEKHIMMHPAVIEAAVVGLPHDIDGEHPMAFVVIKEDKFGQPLVSELELLSFTDARTTEVEKLRGGIRFVKQLPRNAMGKIQRLKLAELARNNI